MRWEIAFVDPTVRARASIVAAEVRRGTCLDDGEAIYREEVRPGEGLPPVPTLGGGPHAFAAVARDAACVEIARGCVEILLPTDDGRVVRTELAETTSTTPICDACSDGVCEGSPRDAGTDAGSLVPDGGGEDAGGSGLAPPSLLHPWDGFVSGRTRRPRLVWQNAAGATRYEVQLEIGCATPCAFPSAAPPVRSDASSTSGVWTFLPAADLVAAPARVHWRVRSCDAAGCGAWSSDVRWMDVDRERHDVDGDGRGDLVIGAPTDDRGATDTGSAFLVRGGASGLAATTELLALPAVADAWLGSAVDLGDLDGDGLADAVIGVEEADVAASTTAGRIVIVPGHRTMGLDVSAARTIDAPDPGAASYFGTSVAIVDDVDGDGLRDVLVGASRSGEIGRAYLFLGRAAPVLLDATPAMRFADTDADGRFGHTVAGASDVDGDGRPDLLIGEPFGDAGAVAARGRVHVVRAGGVDVIEGPADDRLYFGFALAGLGDADGDGYGDVAIGAPYADTDGDEGDEGTLTVHRGGASGLDAAPSASITSSTGADYVHAGWSVAGGDLDGDGDVDLVVSQPGIDGGTGVIDRGMLVVYRNDGGAFAEVASLLSGVEQSYMQFGRTVAAIDVDGDGRAEVIGGAHRFGVDDTGAAWWFRDAFGASLRTAIDAPVAGEARFGWALPGSVGRLPDGLTP